MTISSPDYGRSPVPRYLQVAAAIRRRIEEGIWSPKQKIPTLAELETEFAVARVTVRQAVELLEREGLLRRIQGKGTFVSTKVEDKRWHRLDLSWRTMAESHGSSVYKFLSVRTPVPEPEIAAEDGRAATAYRCLESVQLRKGRPFSCATVHVCEAIVSRAPERFERESPIAVLASLEGLRIGAARERLRIGVADTRTADLLRIGIGEPTAEAHVVVTDEAGTVIYVADVIYRGDCVWVDIDLLAHEPLPLVTGAAD